MSQRFLYVPFHASTFFVAIFYYYFRAEYGKVRARIFTIFLLLLSSLLLLSVLVSKHVSGGERAVEENSARKKILVLFLV